MNIFLSCSNVSGHSDWETGGCFSESHDCIRLDVGGGRELVTQEQIHEMKNHADGQSDKWASARHKASRFRQEEEAACSCCLPAVISAIITTAKIDCYWVGRGGRKNASQRTIVPSLCLNSSTSKSDKENWPISQFFFFFFVVYNF